MVTLHNFYAYSIIPMPRIRIKKSQGAYGPCFFGGGIGHPLSASIGDSMALNAGTSGINLVLDFCFASPFACDLHVRDG